jgi:uncharacterized glyoxalase superfamily protein PhnB
MFRSSQHTHAGTMIATDDHQVLRFYDEVLGLKRWFDGERPYGRATGSRRIFGLEEGESHWMVDFDDPRSGHSLDQRRSGKLKVVRFAASSRLADKRDRSRLWKLVQAGGATQVTDVLADEFGTRAFSFVAPDGYTWTLVQA